MRADRDRLADVLQAIERIECYTIAGRTVFDTDEFIQVWVVRHQQIIGEAASHTGTLLEALTSAIRDVESTRLTRVRGGGPGGPVDTSWSSGTAHRLLGVMKGVCG